MQSRSIPQYISRHTWAFITLRFYLHPNDVTNHNQLCTCLPVDGLNIFNLKQMGQVCNWVNYLILHEACGGFSCASRPIPLVTCIVVGLRSPIRSKHQRHQSHSYNIMSKKIPHLFLIKHSWWISFCVCVCGLSMCVRFVYVHSLYAMSSWKPSFALHSMCHVQQYIKLIPNIELHTVNFRLRLFLACTLHNAHSAHSHRPPHGPSHSMEYRFFFGVDYRDNRAFAMYTQGPFSLRSVLHAWSQSSLILREPSQRHRFNSGNYVVLLEFRAASFDFCLWIVFVVDEANLTLPHFRVSLT